MKTSLEAEDTPRCNNTFHSVKESDREFDANHSWNPRERVIIGGMGDYLERSEDILVEAEKLATCLLGPTDVAGIVTVLEQNACDGGGHRRFVLIPKSECNAVPQGCMQLCQETRTETRGNCRKPSSAWTREAEQDVGDNGAKAQLMSGASDGSWKTRSGRWNMSAHKTNAEMRRLTLRSRKAEAEGLRVCDTSEAVLVKRMVSGAQKL